MPELETPSVDVSEVPADALPSGGGAEQQAPESPTPESKTEDKPKGFRAAFSKAREDLAAVEVAEPAAESETETEDEPAEPLESDEQIPDEEKPDETEEKESTEADKEQQQKAPDARTRKYKEVVEENTKLAAENTAVAEKLGKLNAQFEKFGGVDVVDAAMDVFEKLASGKTDEVINQLPAHERARVQKTIFESALGNPANRLFGINHVLRSDFGLAKDAPQPLMEKAFEYFTERLNSSPEDFEAYLDRELEFYAKPDSELEKLRAEVERLKTQPPADQDKTAAAKTDESPADLGTRIDQTYAEFEDKTFATVSTKIFADYGLDVKATDTPDIKAAKEILHDALKHAVGVKMRTSKAFAPLIPFWVEGDTNNTWFDQAAKGYERANKAKLQETVKAVSKLLGLRKAAPANPPKDAGQPGQKNNTQIPAPGGSRSALPAPKTNKNEAPKGFLNRMAMAKKSAGTKSIG